MRYLASEKLEIIRLIERSHLPVRRALDKLGFPRRHFTAGMTATGPSTKLGLGIRPAAPGAGCGTASRTMSAARSGTWTWTNRNYRPGNWPVLLGYIEPASDDKGDNKF
jgi:hypothetical protein